MLVKVYSYQELHTTRRLIILFYEVGPQRVIHAFQIFVYFHEGRYLFEALSMIGRIILKWIINRV
jgi:hypothetical protein